MRYLAVFMALLLTLAPASVAAQYVRYRLPDGRRCTVAAQTYQCFDLPEYQQLLHIDEDLRHYTELSEIAERRVTLLTQSTENLRLALDASQRNVTLLEAERVRLTALWEEENRLRHEAEERPEWDWIPWTLAGGFAIATLVLGIILGVAL